MSAAAFFSMPNAEQRAARTAPPLYRRRHLLLPRPAAAGLFLGMAAAGVRARRMLPSWMCVQGETVAGSSSQAPQPPPLDGGGGAAGPEVYDPLGFHERLRQRQQDALRAAGLLITAIPDGGGPSYHDGGGAGASHSGSGRPNTNTATAAAQQVGAQHNINLPMTAQQAGGSGSGQQVLPPPPPPPSPGFDLVLVIEHHKTAVARDPAMHIILPRELAEPTELYLKHAHPTLILEVEEDEDNEAPCPTLFLSRSGKELPDESVAGAWYAVQKKYDAPWERHFPPRNMRHIFSDFKIKNVAAAYGQLGAVAAADTAAATVMGNSLRVRMMTAAAAASLFVNACDADLHSFASRFGLPTTARGRQHTWPRQLCNTYAYGGPRPWPGWACSRWGRGVLSKAGEGWRLRRPCAGGGEGMHVGEGMCVGEASTQWHMCVRVCADVCRLY
jgi:hypothetical protein